MELTKEAASETLRLAELVAFGPGLDLEGVDLSRHVKSVFIGVVVGAYAIEQELKEGAASGNKAIAHAHQLWDLVNETEKRIATREINPYWRGWQAGMEE